MHNKKAFLFLMFFAGASLPAHAINDPIMTVMRVQHVFQEGLEYAEMTTSLAINNLRLDIFGRFNNLKSFGNEALGRTLPNDIMRPKVISELKETANRGMKGYQDFYSNLNGLLTVDLSAQAGAKANQLMADTYQDVTQSVAYQKVKDIAHSVNHITSVDGYSKALLAKANATINGIDAVVASAGNVQNLSTKSAQNLKEKMSAFMAFYPPIANKLNSLNHLDSMINSVDSAAKFPTIVGEEAQARTSLKTGATGEDEKE